MKISLPIIACLVLTACGPKTSSQQTPKNAEQMLREETFWRLAVGDVFLDGGSVSLGFIGSEGQIIHVQADVHRNPADGSQRFYLMRTYHDMDGVEILPKSSLEHRVIELLTQYQRRPENNIPDSYTKHFIALMRDRQRPFPKHDDWLSNPK
jgi:hypothetical protein